jgi:hypothetical protein
MADRTIPTLRDDVLTGADEIARFLFGDTAKRRAVYHLASKDGLPTFRLGNTICARRSTLLAWIEAQERAGRAA